MKLIIVRHGDPDYSIDSLTEKGWKEAECLKNRLVKLNIKNFYCSPLGRAKDTSKATLSALCRTAEECDWLREFNGYVIDPKTNEKRIPWDLMPSFWTEDERFYDRKKWLETPIMQTGDVAEKYSKVCIGLDKLLKKHGYRRENNLYIAEKPNNDTILFFCHFGVECVLLSHLMGISPVLLWQNFVALPTSVSVLATEEREEGKAVFRCSLFGDLSHLYAAGEPASFSARFCETFDNKDERH